MRAIHMLVDEFLQCDPIFYCKSGWKLGWPAEYNCIFRQNIYISSLWHLYLHPTAIECVQNGVEDPQHLLLWSDYRWGGDSCLTVVYSASTLDPVQISISIFPEYSYGKGWCCWNLTDVTLADEDTYTIPIDEANRTIPSNLAIQVPYKMHYKEHSWDCI